MLFALSSLLSKKMTKGFSQIAQIDAQMNADEFILSAEISGFFLRDQREIKLDEDKIKDKRQKIKDEKSASSQL